MNWSQKKIREFVRDRDTAFTNAVLNDDWEGVAAYLEKYKMRGAQMMRDKAPVAKAAIYKAVHECTNIPDHVKDIAAEKCIELGFSPFVNWEEMP